MKKKCETKQNKRKKTKKQKNIEEEDFDNFQIACQKLIAVLRLANAKINSDIQKGIFNINNNENINENNNENAKESDLPSTSPGTLNIDNSLSTPLLFNENINNESISGGVLVNDSFEKNDEDEFSFIIKNKFNENHKNNINKMIRKENDLEYEYYFDFCYPSNGVFPNSNENDL